MFSRFFVAPPGLCLGYRHFDYVGGDSGYSHIARRAIS